MKFVLLLGLCLCLGAQDAHAQWFKNGVKSVFKKSVTAEKEAAGKLAEAGRACVNDGISVALRQAATQAMKRELSGFASPLWLSLEGGDPQVRRLVRRSFYNYHLTAARYFPQTVEGGALRGILFDGFVRHLPGEILPQSVMLNQISNIHKPYTVYMQASLLEVTDIYSKFLTAGKQSPGENWRIYSTNTGKETISKADYKTWNAMRKDLLEQYNASYAALPAQWKDLNAQLGRVLEDVQHKTGWSAERMKETEIFFLKKLKPFIAKQNALTPIEFLQAYDVLAVASQLPAFYQESNGLRRSVWSYLPAMRARMHGGNLVKGALAGNGFLRTEYLDRWFVQLY